MKEKEAITKVEIMPELARRWSTRAFSSKAVEVEKLTALFEAARWAPSSSNVQPWRFIIARKSEGHFNKLAEGLMEGNAWAKDAPVLVANLARKTRTASDGSEKPNKHSWHDLGLAMGNLSAQATAMGLYLHQMAGIHPTKVAENFEVDTDEFDVVSMFALGYRDANRVKELDESKQSAEENERKRKALSDLIFSEKFGKNPEWLKVEK